MFVRDPSASKPRPRPPRLAGYLVSVASVGAATFLTQALGEATVGISPMFFASVMISAWYGGLGPGLLATGLAGLISAFFLFEPTYSFDIGWDDVIRILVFTGVAVVISSLQDATRRQHGRMLEARDEALAASRAKDRFLAVLSHELRTPLSPVLATAGVLESDARLPADVRDDMRMIARNIELETRLIDDLLDLSRLEQGKLALRLEDTDAHALVRDVLAMCTYDIERKAIRVRIALAAERSFVRADATRLRQAVWNLVRNAAKFTPAGGEITVTSSCTRDGALRVEITDTGMGIEPHVLPRIFEAFEQGGEGTLQRFGGLGLGLAISRSFVAAHGGTLEASSPGKARGATFLMTLPTIDAPAQAASELARSHESERVASLRVLLVEDHPDTSRALSRILRGVGHEVTVAGNLEDALGAADDPSLTW